jgi:hypothetical protein
VGLFAPIAYFQLARIVPRINSAGSDIRSEMRSNMAAKKSA